MKARNQVLSDEGDTTFFNDNDSDVTTEEPFLKKCIVDGNAYSHSQTVRIDKVYYSNSKKKDSFPEFLRKPVKKSILKIRCFRKIEMRDYKLISNSIKLLLKKFFYVSYQLYSFKIKHTESA